MKTLFDLRKSRRIEKERYVKCTTLSGGIFYINHTVEEQIKCM